MSVIGNNILAGASGQSVGGYVIDRSLRFRASASAFLNRTPASATNRTTWTWSGWVKIGQLGVNRTLFGASNTDENNEFQFQLSSGNTLAIQQTVGGSTAGQISASTTAVFRDPSAWYHIVLAIDTTQGTPTNRAKLYVNGVQQTWGSYTVNSVNTWVNNNSAHTIGKQAPPNSGFLDGYLTEINFVDGQALDPDSFGEYNEDTGVWQPKEYAGTYGTNGFYLNFGNPTTLTTLTADQSGNGNNWTANNISLTSGATFDSMIDTPTPVADVRGNFCVLNPLDSASPSLITNGNLQINAVSDACATMSFASSKWYFEITRTDGASNIAQFHYGLLDSAHTSADRSTSTFTKGILYRGDGVILRAGSTLASGLSSVGQNSILGVAFDMDAKTVQFFVNNVAQSTAQSILDSEVMPWTLTSATSSSAANFGQRPFAYTPPSGFKALHTGNLPEPAIVDGGEYFNTVLYTGTGAAQTISGVGFQPDWVWLKSRGSATFSHFLVDQVRGNTKYLISNVTDAETTNTNRLTSFDSDGFTVGDAGGSVNGSGESIVAWNWKANGAGVSNTAGSITSTVSAGVTQGFSVVTYTGTGSNATVGHGLGVAPAMVIVKSRSFAGENWRVWQVGLSSGTHYLNLNTTAAQASNSTFFTATPTSTVINVGTDDSTNRNTTTYVAYCFAEVPGYSRFGSYTGNGSADGPFIFTGFRPAWVMIKRTDAAGEPWNIYDNQRLGFNPASKGLYANSSDAENDASGRYKDLLSNGFKIRGTSGEQNASGGTYIFMAFAENPFALSLAR